MQKNRKTFIFIITLFMTIALVSCDNSLTATMTTAEIDEILTLFSNEDITHESRLPSFEGTVVKYTLNDTEITDLTLYKRPLFDQFQALSARIYGSDQTITLTYNVYVLSSYSPRHNYQIDLDFINLNTMTRETYQQGFIQMKQNDKSLFNESQAVNVRYRGNSSWANHQKKSFRIMFERDVEIMGLDAHDTYYLISMHADKALMRDVLVHQLAHLLKIEKTHQTRYVELFINGTYHGLYMLIEDRTYEEVDRSIDELQFSLELDYRAEWENYEDETWFYANGTPYVVKRPLEISLEDVESIKQYIMDIQQDLTQNNASIIDIDIRNWATYFFIQEYFKNVDAWGLSTFLYKSIEQPLRFGPVWDFDLSVGNADYVDDNYSQYHGYWFIDHPLAIWPNLALQSNEIKDAFDDVIINFYINHFQTFRMMINTLGVALIPYAEKNFERWPVLNTYVWPNPDVLLTDTYLKQVQFVTQFLENRIQWMVEETSS